MLFFFLELYIYLYIKKIREEDRCQAFYSALGSSKWGKVGVEMKLQGTGAQDTESISACPEISQRSLAVGDSVPVW